MTLSKHTEISFFWHAAVVKEYAEFVGELSNYFQCKITLYVPDYWEEIKGQKDSLSSTDLTDYPLLRIKKIFAFPKSKYKYFIWNPVFVFKAFRSSDIVISITEPYIFSAFSLLISKSFFKNTKLVLFSAQNINKCFPFPFSLLERKVLKSTDAFLTCNRAADDVLDKKGFLGKTIDFPLGIPKNEIIYLSQLERKFASSDFNSTLKVLYVGRLVKQKGIEDIIRIIEHFGDSPNICFDIVGHGDYYNKLLHMSKRYTNVHIHGSVKRSQVEDYLKQANINLMLSYDMANVIEQFGRTIVEAHARGVPTIGYNSGEVKRVVSEGGYIFEQGDVNGVISAIDKLANDKDCLKKLSLTSLNLGKKYTWDNIARNVGKELNIVKEI